MELQQTEVKNGKEGLHINVAQMCVTAVLMALTCVATMVVQIPIPLGYAHLGDSVILISAYFFGPVVGALAGGIGSALADLIGFPVFAPITLIVKGLEGLICGLGKPGRKADSFIFPALGVLFMVAGYFLGTWLFPNLGKVVALTDFPVNLIQATVGYLGGRALFGAYTRITS